MISPYAEQMLEKAMERYGGYSRMVIRDIKDALFGPPTKEVAGECECGEVADVFGEDYCRECWGE